MPFATVRRTVTLTAVSLLLAASPSAAQETPRALTDLSTAFEALVREISPSVVQIFATAVAPVGGDPRAPSQVLAQQRRGGSGVIVSSDGYIVTNNHVVEGARRLYVVLAEPASDQAPGQSLVRPVGRRVMAEIVGTDLETDLAVLKIEETGLPYMEFRDSDEVHPGHVVLAFGSPLGLSSTVTMGVVSAVGRQLREDAPMVYIQTDAPINPGNSGGPLVDTEGRLVGINTMILSQSGGSEGLGFAAPSNIVQAVFDQIKSHGRVRRGMIGANTQTITPTMATGLRLTRNWGVIVSDVYPGSPAARAGLQVGDIIESLDAKPMENARQFDVNVYGKDPGSVVTLNVRRALGQQSIRVPVAERANDPGRFADLVDDERNLVATLGLLAVELNDQIAGLMPWLRERAGVVVAAQAYGVVGAPSGLQPADVILSVNGQAVMTLGQLNSILGRMDPGDPVVLHVDRLGQRMFLVFEME
ncbi:MAG: trypsin-like peptidase domain-containing protein [Gemmatimonadota bacterium]|nr:MAG: trypsin-like peptidase domain-containing protein [Gemmatimonadota bacterium]